MSLVGIIVSHVGEVQVLLEHLANHLGALVHARHPLVDEGGGPIEIPLQIQLRLLLRHVIKVAVQHQFRA